MTGEHSEGSFLVAKLMCSVHIWSSPQSPQNELQAEPSFFPIPSHPRNAFRCPQHLPHTGQMGAKIEQQCAILVQMTLKVFIKTTSHWSHRQRTIPRCCWFTGTAQHCVFLRIQSRSTQITPQLKVAKAKSVFFLLHASASHKQRASTFSKHCREAASAHVMPGAGFRNMTETKLGRAERAEGCSPGNARTTA